MVNSSAGVTPEPPPRIPAHAYAVARENVRSFARVAGIARSQEVDFLFGGAVDQLLDAAARVDQLDPPTDEAMKRRLLVVPIVDQTMRLIAALGDASPPGFDDGISRLSALFNRFSGGLEWSDDFLEKVRGLSDARYNGRESDLGASREWLAGREKFKKLVESYHLPPAVLLLYDKFSSRACISPGSLSEVTATLNYTFDVVAAVMAPQYWDKYLSKVFTKTHAINNVDPNQPEKPQPANNSSWGGLLYEEAGILAVPVYKNVLDIKVHVANTPPQNLEISYSLDTPIYPELDSSNYVMIKNEGKITVKPALIDPKKTSVITVSKAVDTKPGKLFGYGLQYCDNLSSWLDAGLSEVETAAASA